jgi:hypothetical protein
LNQTLRPFCFGYFGDGSCDFSQAGLQLHSFLSQPPKSLGLQVWATRTHPLELSLSNSTHIFHDSLLDIGIQYWDTMAISYPPSFRPEILLLQ